MNNGAEFIQGVRRGLGSPKLLVRVDKSITGDWDVSTGVKVVARRAIPEKATSLEESPDTYGYLTGEQMRREFIKELKQLLAELEG